MTFRDGRQEVPRAFRVLLLLFPRGFRYTFGDQMRDVFFAQHHAARGPRARTRLWLRTISGMTLAAWHERADARRRVGHRLPLGETVVADFRVGCRMIARAPLFSAVAIAAISIGVGCVATIFSALNAIVLRPLPGTTDGARLVEIDRRSPDFSEGVSGSVRFYEYLRESTVTLDGVAAWSRVPLSVVIDEEAVGVAGNIVSGNYFDVLGVRPEAGRFFGAEAQRAADAPPEVVLSHSFWTTHLNSDPSAVGRFLRVNGRAYRVIGIAPSGFRGVFTPVKIDAWVPLGVQHHVRPSDDDPATPWLWMFGRLRPSRQPAEARSELAARTAAWVKNAGDRYSRYSSIRLSPLTGLPDDARRALLRYGAILLGAAALVLIIASANVSSLLAVRALARRREMAIRTALGAGRWRLVRQLLVETLMLFAAGAVGGTLLAAAGTFALERISLPADSGFALELSPDLRVLAFAFLVALLAGVVVGLGPALTGTSRNPAATLRSDTPGSGRRSRITSALIVGQLACSLVLLTAAGLFVRALAAGAALDPGFDTHHVVVSTFDTQSYGDDEPAGRAFYAALARGLEREPGIDGFSFANAIPLTVSMNGTIVSVERTGSAESIRLLAEAATVDTGYFRTLGISIVDGRAISAADTAQHAPVAVVNETFARHAWPDASALGRTIDLYGTRVTVVGVARNAKYSTLTEGAVSFVYEPMAQHWTSGQTLFLRTGMTAGEATAALSAVVTSIDAQLPRPTVTPLAQETEMALLPQRVAAMITSILGFTGLALASLALYGLVSYGVALRRREIGIRLALGARGADVVGLMLSHGLRLTVAGAVVGLVAARFAARLVGAYLVNVSTMDLPSFGAAVGVLILVALTAAYLPARRAAAADPLVALHSE
ncbi:MAG TPA: ABC transporter permease [Vicinamibacterales bacterium]